MKVELYFIFTDEFKDNSLSQFELYLSENERNKMHKFLFEKDKKQFLLSRTLARKILSLKSNLHFSQLQFGQNSFGKPYLVNNFQNLAFNISHTEGLLVLAVVDNAKTIGVDVENISRKIDWEVRNTFFTENESFIYEKLSKEEKEIYFFDLWTLKESYMKAIGKGFSLSPKSFSFITKNGKYQFNENEFESSYNEFVFQLFDIAPFYKIALCHTNDVTKVSTFRVLPNWQIVEQNVFSSPRI